MAKKKFLVGKHKDYDFTWQSTGLSGSEFKLRSAKAELSGWTETAIVSSLADIQLLNDWDREEVLPDGPYHYKTPKKGNNGRRKAAKKSRRDGPGDTEGEGACEMVVPF